MQSGNGSSRESDQKRHVSFSLNLSLAVPIPFPRDVFL